MDNYVPVLQDKIGQILKDIKERVLDEHGLHELHVADISFSLNDGCPVGTTKVCHNYGINPTTGQPIIVCHCVPNSPLLGKIGDE